MRVGEKRRRERQSVIEGQREIERERQEERQTEQEPTHQRTITERERRENSERCIHISKKQGRQARGETAANTEEKRERARREGELRAWGRYIDR